MHSQVYTYNHASFGTGNGPAGVVVTDFNHDGTPDLAVTNAAANTVSILLGTRGGAFAAKVDYATGHTPAALLAADFRHVGKTDLARLSSGCDRAFRLIDLAIAIRRG